MPPKNRVARQATVVEVERIGPQMARLTFECPDLVGAALPHTDHYVKILFPPAGADYSWPFDPDQIRATNPEQAPVTRTYSIRSYDPTTGRAKIDFVVHGDTGLAGPWAAKAQPGDQVGFFGPGGAWHPTEDYEHFVLAGDEAAAPAIAAAIDRLPAGTTATAYVEIADADSTFEIPQPNGVELVWVTRDGASYGSELARTVRTAGVPAKRTGWFVHGVAEMVKDLRRFLFVEQGVSRGDVSISGYWRTGMNEDRWQSTKHEFVESMESEEAAALS
ncbi:siderophore-interacting protein [Tessaracoccus caeni]|uniref:siderophore-interacting protein n=1 Tax=Tessaracoccus caeni TaxID=3031239 RepID=UPI0023DC41AD|nr:siderophore-interacting protein [Tessaracoccus caeni]MDF1489373.1 siderophore-interacting protein [Tessaracoccus caeni]